METIHEDKNKKLKITIDKNYDQQFLEFAESVLWGTESMLYKMNNVEPEFKKFTLFVSLKENDELIGICLLYHKQIHQDIFTFDAFYRSFLCVHPAKLNKGYGTLIMNKITEYVFTKFDKAIIYAYVEPENSRSKGILQKTNESHITTFMALSHVSLMPKPNKYANKLDENDKEEMLTLLNHQYSNHSFVDINESFDAESYYVFKENNKIKAGLQVKVLSWSFVNFPGFYGFLLMKIVPKIPVLKKIFNPKNHSFLKVGNIYIEDSRCFSKLLDAVLYRYKFNTNVACLNPHSNIDSKIIREMKKGILSSVGSKLYMFYKSKNIYLHDMGVTSENCFFSNF